MAKTETANWVDINVDTLSLAERGAYDAYKQAQREAAELRSFFEKLMNEHAPEGKRLVFGYRFGKLSAAIVEGEAKPAAKAAPKALSMAQLMQMQGRGQ